MAKVKKDIPKYTSPYKEINVVKEALSFTIEVLNPEDNDEVEKQTNMKYEVLVHSTTDYSESTLKRIPNLPDKLFLCGTEEEVLKLVTNSINMTFTKEFKARAFADVLRSKLHLITNEDYKKLMKYTLESLDDHLCITTVIKSMFSLLTVK